MTASSDPTNFVVKVIQAFSITSTSFEVDNGSGIFISPTRGPVEAPDRDGRERPPGQDAGARQGRDDAGRVGVCGW